MSGATKQSLEIDAPSLEYASSCFIPTTWLPLPLIEKREYNHDSTIYGFGLPEGQSLSLPVCGCILMKAPGKGRKEGGGKDDWDGSDAVRPYTPMSDNSVLGQFQLLVKRYDGGAASQYLHSLDIGAPVEFKHISFNVKKQYPFDGSKTISLVCAGSGITPMYQALWKILGTEGDDRKVTLLYGNKTVEDILMKDELDAWAKAHPDRFRLVHVVGNRPDEPPPAGWESTSTYTAETGWCARQAWEACMCLLLPRLRSQPHSRVPIRLAGLTRPRSKSTATRRRRTLWSLYAACLSCTRTCAGRAPRRLSKRAACSSGWATPRRCSQRCNRSVWEGKRRPSVEVTYMYMHMSCRTTATNLVSGRQTRRSGGSLGLCSLAWRLADLGFCHRVC